LSVRGKDDGRDPFRRYVGNLPPMSGVFPDYRPRWCGTRGAQDENGALGQQLRAPALTCQREWRPRFVVAFVASLNYLPVRGNTVSP
jgi:hypothetical protein